MNPIIIKIRQELKKHSDPQTRASSQNFFKEKVRPYGVRTAIVSRVSKNYFTEVKDLDSKKFFSLCEELWKSGYLEESFIACDWAYRARKNYKEADFKVLEKWVNTYVSNWAACDTLCNHAVGSFVEMYPQYLKNLKQWARSKNRWVRRAAAVSLIIPARHGKFLDNVFAIADILLSDGDDLVQKGYGWMLKAASQAHQKEVFDFVIKNKSKMPRTALRYAIEKMPKTLKTRAMAR